MIFHSYGNDRALWAAVGILNIGASVFNFEIKRKATS
jgi:hypothetical protein